MVLGMPDPGPLDELRGSDFLSRYEPGEFLGKGACGAVFRARQVSLDRAVVVKILDLEAPAAADLAVRFEQEAAIQAGLRHPNVVELLDYGIEPRFVFLVYPDEGGKSLTDWFRRRGAVVDGTPLPVDDTVVILRNVLSGLAHVHAAGVVHRDLKPSNVLVTGRGEIKLIDFGLAKDPALGLPLTRTGSVVGTPNYMSPDQVKGNRPDPRDDLYAVGVMAYEMLSGKNPFAARDLPATLHQHLSFDPPLLHLERTDIPQPLSVLVADLLAKDRDSRPATAGEALERLSAGPSGPAFLPFPPTPEPRPAEPVALPSTRHRSRPGPGPAGLLMVGALMLGIGVLLPRPVPPPPTATPAPTAASEGPIDVGFRARMEAELEVAIETSAGAAERFPDPDPAAWGRQARRLAGLQVFRAWATSSRTGTGLDVERLSDLAALDRSFTELGLPAPFAVVAEARPGPDTDLSSWLGTLPPPIRAIAPPRAAGWFAAGLEAVRELDAFSLRLAPEVEAARVAAVRPERIPASIWVPYLLLREGKVEGRAPDLLAMVPKIQAGGPEARIGILEWLGEGTGYLDRGLYALGRSLREEPTTRGAAALVLIELLDRHRVLLVGASSFEHPWPLCWGEPGSPAEAHAEAWLLRRRLDVLRSDPSIGLEARRDRIRDLLVAAIGFDPAADGPAERARRAAGVGELGRVLVEHLVPDRVVPAFRRLWSALASPATLTSAERIALVQRFVGSFSTRQWWREGGKDPEAVSMMRALLGELADRVPEAYPAVVASLRAQWPEVGTDFRTPAGSP